jgi:hypothetical protein
VDQFEQPSNRESIERISVSLLISYFGQGRLDIAVDKTDGGAFRTLNYRNSVIDQSVLDHVRKQISERSVSAALLYFAAIAIVKGKFKCSQGHQLPSLELVYLRLRSPFSRKKPARILLRARLASEARK